MELSAYQGIGIVAHQRHQVVASTALGGPHGMGAQQWSVISEITAQRVPRARGPLRRIVGERVAEHDQRIAPQRVDVSIVDIPTVEANGELIVRRAEYLERQRVRH